MTVRADDLPFKDGVVRWFVGLHALLLVTGEADFGLGARVTDLVVGRM